MKRSLALRMVPAVWMLSALAAYGAVVAATGLFGPHHLYALGICFGLAHGAVFPAKNCNPARESFLRRGRNTLQADATAPCIFFPTDFPTARLMLRSSLGEITEIA